MQEIYDVWYANLPRSATELVVKTARTITLIPSYPHRRIKIFLHLPASATEVLLNFDLDACALGFDGERVVMLPRCARALETGYSTFTMDLLVGHHIGHRRETSAARLWKYADRGFGIRILPSYAERLGYSSTPIRSETLSKPMPCVHPIELIPVANINTIEIL